MAMWSKTFQKSGDYNDYRRFTRGKHFQPFLVLLISSHEGVHGPCYASSVRERSTPSFLSVCTPFVTPQIMTSTPVLHAIKFEHCADRWLDMHNFRLQRSMAQVRTQHCTGIANETWHTQFSTCSHKNRAWVWRKYWDPGPLGFDRKTITNNLTR